MSGQGPGPEAPDEIHVLAGEYVLGVLDLAEMRAVRRRAVGDTTLAAAILGWEVRLAPLAEAVPPAPPPAALWDRIAEAVAATPETPVVPVVPLVPRSRRDGAGPRPRRVWPWQVATLAALAVAAGIAAFALLPPPVAPVRVAALMPANMAIPGFLVEAQPDGRVVLTALAPVQVPPGRDLELWILPLGAKTPASLGVLPPSGRQIVLPKAPAAGTQLMVSMEPRGGSPTGAPTGPVVYAGTLGI